MSSKTSLLFSGFLFYFILIGCASYQLGTPGGDEYSSVYVKPIRNDSTYPLLEQSLTSSIIRAINESGSLSTASQSNAETTLEIIVSNANREIAAVTSQDVGRGRKFEMQFDVLCSLYRNNGNNDIIFQNRSISVSQDIFADSGQVNAEHQAGPEISRKISQRVANLLTDVW